MTEHARSLFPDPRTVPGDEPFARGENYQPHVLIDAYAHGIFPWPYDDGEVYWWSPDPRAVIWPDALRVTRSLRRTLRRSGWRCTADAAFARVVAECARQRGDQTWITDAYQEGYRRLHDVGVAHSIEVWEGGELVGGLYGVVTGAVFTGESMFHRRTDASKAALVGLRNHMRGRGLALIDAQLPTAHLATLGATAMPRAAFLDLLDDLGRRRVPFSDGPGDVDLAP